MHTVFALLCFVVVIHWLIFPYPSGLLHWHCGNLTIAPVPAKQPWWIWINTSCEFIMNDCITTTKQSTTKPCAYFLGYTVHASSTGPSMVKIMACHLFGTEPLSAPMFALCQLDVWEQSSWYKIYVSVTDTNLECRQQNVSHFVLAWPYCVDHSSDGPAYI